MRYKLVILQVDKPEDGHFAQVVCDDLTFLEGVEVTAKMGETKFGFEFAFRYYEWVNQGWKLIHKS